MSLFDFFEFAVAEPDEPVAVDAPQAEVAARPIQEQEPLAVRAMLGASHAPLASLSLTVLG